MSLIVKRNIAIVKKGVEAWVQQQPVVYVEPLCVARLTPRFDVRGFENVDLRAARGGAFAPKLDEFLAESALTDSREYYQTFSVSVSIASARICCSCAFAMTSATSSANQYFRVAPKLPLRLGLTPIEIQKCSNSSCKLPFWTGYEP